MQTPPAEFATRGASLTELGLVVLVALLGNYALLPSTLMPALVSTWVAHLGVDDAAAGRLASLGLVGHACGMLAGVWLLSRRTLPVIAATGLVIGVVADLASAPIHSLGLMGAARLVNGAGLGLVLAAAVNWLGRQGDPSRAFAVFTVLQFCVPSALLTCFAPLRTMLHDNAVYALLVAAGLAACALIPFLAKGGAAGLLERGRRRAGAGKVSIHFIAAVAALGLFNIASMGVWAFAVRYGEANGLAAADAARAAGLSSAFGVPGGLLALFLGVRAGRARTLAFGLAVFIAAVASLGILGHALAMFYLGVCAMTAAWAFVVPYIQGTQAALDASGQLPVWGLTAAAGGASLGPAVFGIVSKLASFPAAFACAAVIAGLCALCIWPAARSVDEQGAGGLAPR
jgi:AAHS family benzoate transporter-like MFS transporter